MMYGPYNVPVTGKKFLYDDHKRGKDNSNDRQFHSKGYNPGPQRQLLDLDSVWSVKNIALETKVQPAVAADVNSHAGTSYYSRYGQYNSPNSTHKHTSSAQHNPNSASSKSVQSHYAAAAPGDSGNYQTQWSKRSAESLSTQQKQHQVYHSNFDSNPRPF